MMAATPKCNVLSRISMHQDHCATHEDALACYRGRNWFFVSMHQIPDLSKKKKHQTKSCFGHVGRVYSKKNKTKQNAR